MKDTISAQQIAGDLVRMHEKRINTYKQILHESGDMELDIKSIFERIIDESITCVQQLQNKAHPDTTKKGEVYSSWKEMQKPVLNGDKKEILEVCANDELVTINTYSVALSMLADHDIVKLLQQQQQELKKLHAHIRKFHDAQ
jgi:rubrerythrin